MKSRAQLFAKLQPQVLTEVIVQPLLVRISATKAGKHEGNTYYISKAKEAPKVEVMFEHRFLDEPVIVQGVSSVGFKLASGGTKDKPTYSDYAGDWKITLAGILKKDSVIVGATFYVNPRDVMTAGFDEGSYPLNGTLRFTACGLAATPDMGKVDDWTEFPSEDTSTKDHTEYDTDAPSAPTNVQATSGLIDPSGSTSKTAEKQAYIHLTWDAVAHNDLVGYNADIFEDTTGAMTLAQVTDADFATYPPALYIEKEHTDCHWLDLTLGSHYFMRVQAIDAKGNTSAWVTIGPQATPICDKPPTFSTITTQTFRPNIIEVMWAYADGTANTNTVGECELEYSTDGGTTWSSPVDTKDHAYYFTGLDQTLTYYFRVRAVSAYNTGTDSDYSDWLTTASGTQPSGLLDMDVQANALYNRLTEGGVLTGNLAKAAITADKIAAGAISSYLVNVVNRFRGTTVAFTGGSNTISWNTGTVTLAKATYSGASLSDVTWGTTDLSIAGGSSGLSASTLYYAYVTYTEDTNGEPSGISGVTISTTYPIGKDDIVLAYFQTNSSGAVSITPAHATGTIISGDHILTGSIDASRITVSSLSALSANIGTVTAGLIESSSGYSYLNLSNNTFHLGGASGTGLDWNGSALTISGYATSSDLATTNSNVAAAQSKADNAYILAQNPAWSSLSGKPARFADAPSGAGLCMTASYLGYYNGGSWTAYMDASGNFSLGTQGSSNYLYWNGSTLSIAGNIIASGLISGALISSPVISGGMIVGTTFETSSSGQRVQIDSSGQGSITWYDGNGNEAAQIYLSGEALTILPNAAQGGTLQIPVSIYLGYGAGINFNGSSLYVSGGHLYFGSTQLA